MAKCDFPDHLPDEARGFVNDLVAPSIQKYHWARAFLRESDATVTGSILAWPITIPDFLWSHLLANGDAFFASRRLTGEQIQAEIELVDRQVYRQERLV